MTHILFFDEGGAGDVSQTGGKGASLAQLSQAGLPVPPGFVVTTDAFREGMSANLEKDILAAFDRLGAGRVAVRSSAAEEDSSDASWAGQLETVLNVTRDGLIAGVEHCWQSISSERARTYGAEHGVSVDQQAVAVVVQTMVDSEISGVMFTTNPVTGNPDELVIEAIYGLGELLVQGSVTPESLTLSKASGEILTRSAHQQTQQLVYRDGENVEVELPSSANGEILNKQQLASLTTLAEQVEAHYGTPQDIEWAMNRGQLYLLQSRPITTLTGTSNTLNNLPNWPDDEIFQWGPIRGRYFYISDYVSAAIDKLPQAFPGENFPQTLLLFHDEHMIWLCNLSDFTSYGQHLFQKYMENDGVREDIYKDWRTKIQLLETVQKTIANTYLTQLSSIDFQKLWGNFYEAVIDFWLPTFLPELGNYGSPSLLKEQLSKLISDEAELIAAMETLTAPEKLSFYQQEELELAKTKDIKAHQQKYFWLKNSYGTVQVLPEKFFEERKVELEKDLGTKSGAEITNAQKATKDKLQARYHIPSEIRRRADVIANNVVWQDERKRYLTENFHYKWLLIQELSRRSGQAVEMLLDYSFDQLSNVLKGTKSGLPKKASCFGVAFHTALQNLTAMQAQSYWDRYTTTTQSIGQTLQGTTASRGADPVVRGAVRVLHSSHAILEPGEILVTAMTSPGYIFAMRNARAVITDVGGLTSHAAIVSRELNIPCIVGTKVATKVLKDGDIVEVDAKHGRVKLISAQPVHSSTGLDEG